MGIEHVLQTELDFYTEHKNEFVRLYKGRFLLIKGRVVVNACTTEAEAYRAGVEQFGNAPFLIKQVIENETPVVYPALTIGVISMPSLFGYFYPFL